LFCSRSCCS